MFQRLLAATVIILSTAGGFLLIHVYWNIGSRLING